MEQEFAVRKEHVITYPDGRREDHPSINAAKRKSREIQKQGIKVRIEHPLKPAWDPPIRGGGRSFGKTLRMEEMKNKEIKVKMKNTPRRKITSEDAVAAAKRFVSSGQ
jgi:hypothetical protein